MTIIDRHVLRLFFKVLVVSFLSIAGLYMVIDAFGNLDEFLSIGEQDGGLLKVLGQYYGARVLEVFEMTSPLLALLAAMFAIAWMQRTNEMTAIMAAGVPKSRVVRPLLVAALLVSLLAVANREFVIPQYRDKLTRNAQNWLGDKARPLRAQYDHQTDILLAGRQSIAKERKIVQPNFRLLTRIGTFTRQLSAKEAVYLPPQEDRPGGYLFSGVEVPADLSQHPSAAINGRPVILSPSDTDWLAADQCFVVSRIDFDQLASGTVWRRYASSAELIRGFHNPATDYGAHARVEIHSRFVQPFLDMTLLLLGLPIVMTREQRNLFVAAGLGLLVIIGFFIVVLGCHALGTAGLVSPAFAAWLPLIIFAPLAYVLAQPLRE